MCDSYEARLMETLKGLTPSQSKRSSDALAAN
jgi:hypothetical protein